MKYSTLNALMLASVGAQHTCKLGQDRWDHESNSYDSFKAAYMAGTTWNDPTFEAGPDALWWDDYLNSDSDKANL
jgi:hypothetical protein